MRPLIPKPIQVPIQEALAQVPIQKALVDERATEPSTVPFATEPSTVPFEGARSIQHLMQSLTPRALCLAAALWGVVVTPGFAESASPDPMANAPGQVPAAQQLEAAYQFALGKWLADRSEFDPALEAYGKAVELAPEDPYGWIEIAKLNSYLSQISRTRQQQVSYLEEALENIERARELSSDNIDVLTLYAQTHMRLAGERPASMALAQGAYELLREMQPEDPGTLSALGQIYLWNRDGEKAVEVLTEAARFHSSNRVLQSMLVEALLGTGKSEDAEKALETLIKLEPESSEHRVRLAELRSERGDHAGAVEVLEKAPGDDWLGGARVRQLLAREYHLSGRHEDALRALDEHLASESATSRSAVTLTDGHRRLRTAVLSALLRYGEAIKVFEPVADRSTDPERRMQDAMLLSRLHERVGEFDRAVAVLQREAAKAEGKASIQLALAVAGAQDRAGQHESALATLAALEQDGDARTRAVAAQGRAEILEALRQPERAAAVLEKTAAGLAEEGSAELAQAVTLRQAMIESGAENWQRVLDLTDKLLGSSEAGIRSAARAVRMDALNGSGRSDEALALLEQETEVLDPRQLLAKRVELLFGSGRREEALSQVAALAENEDPDELFFASQLFQRHEAYEQAASLLTRLANQSLGNARVLFALGAAQERSGQSALAEETFLRLLENQPDHAPTLNYLGYLWAEQGANLDRALGMIQKAVSQDPDNGAYVDSLGWAYFQLGRYEDARFHLEWASRLEPSDPTVFVHLGDVYAKLDKSEPALSAYQRALDLNPGEEEAQGIKSRIERLTSPDSQSPAVRPQDSQPHESRSPAGASPRS